MNRQKHSQPQLQPAVHPSDIIKKEWILSRQSIHANGLVVEHHTQPPDEIVSPPLTHHVLALQLNNGSRQITRFDGQEYDGTFLQGESWLLPAGFPGFWHWESIDEAIIFIIDPTFLYQVAAETNCLNPDKIELFGVLKTRDPQIESIALSFKQEMKNDRIGGQLFTESLANILAIHLLRNYCAFKPTLQEYEGKLAAHKLDRILDYIHAHLHKEIKLNELARLVNVSGYYFCRLFKQSTGISPYRYVIQQRVERAKQFLKQKDLSIADIAQECGFAHHSHLTRHFRQLTGITPKAYRRGIF